MNVWSWRYFNVDSVRLDLYKNGYIKKIKFLNYSRLRLLPPNTLKLNISKFELNILKIKEDSNAQRIETDLHKNLYLKKTKAFI